MTSARKAKRETFFDDGFMVGVATGLSIVAVLFSNEKVERWMEHDAPLRPLPAAIVVSLLVIGALAWALRERNRLAAVVIIANVPMLVGAGVVRFSEPNPAWAASLRGAGIAFAIAATLIATLMFARQKRELERTVYHEGTAVAFFVILLVTTVYAVLDTTFDAVPDVPLIVIPAFVLVTWMVAIDWAERKYS